MKKILFVAFVGLLSLTGSALAGVDCDSVQVCTLERDDGGCHPAVLWMNEAPQTVSGTFSVCDGQDCTGQCSDPGDFTFDFGKGLVGVLLTFPDEPPTCTMFSSQWVVDGCDPACGNHHCVTTNCPMGITAADLKEIVVK